MVVIDGIKYACERCIRGHRVTSCTHTDQPLTMIKPKGRPSTQCQHCKEQRKYKNLHINCACKKKGATGHVPGCANGACTCYQHHKLKHRVGNAINGVGEPDKVGSGETNGMMMNSINPINDYLLDNSFLSFQQYSDESLSNPKDDLDSGQELDSDNKHPYMHWSSNPEINELFSNGYNSIEIPKDDSDDKSELESTKEPNELVSETSFPLFSLVGTSSFETNESMPLTQLPKASNVSRNGSVNGNYFSSSSRPNRPGSVLSLNSNTSSVDHSAYPPQITKSSSTTNLKASKPQLNNLKAPIAKPANISGITETNELYISDEEIENFLNGKSGHFGLSPSQF